MAFSYWPGPIVTSYAAYAYHILSIVINGHRLSVCITWSGIHLLIQSDWGQQILNNQYLSLTVFSFLHVRRAVAVDIYLALASNPIFLPCFICLRNDNSNNFAPYMLFYVVLMFCYMLSAFFFALQTIQPISISQVPPQLIPITIPEHLLAPRKSPS